MFRNKIVEQTEYLLEFDSVDSGIAYQFLYTSDVNESFTEEQSTIYNSYVKGEQWKHNKVSIHFNKPIKTLRFDFGSTPGTVKIKNVVLNDKEIELGTIAENLNDNVDSYQLTDKYLEIQSNQADPFSIIDNLDLQPSNKLNISYYILNTILALYFVALFLVKDFRDWLFRLFKRKNK